MEIKPFCRRGIISIIFILAVNQLSFAQVPFGDRFVFDYTQMDQRFMVKQTGKLRVSDTALNLAFRTFSPSVESNTNPIKPKSPIILGVKLNSSLKYFYGADAVSISKNYPCYMINDSSDAILIGIGISPENVSDYKYHVVENDSTEIIPWSPIPSMEQNYGALRPYAFFGKFNAPGKQLIIEIVNSNDYNIRDGVVFDWRLNFKPIVNQIIARTSTEYFNINYRKMNKGYATKFDTLSGIPLNLKFPLGSIESFGLYFENHQTIPYTILLKKEINGVIDTSEIDNYIIKDYYDFYKTNFDVPGKYELIIRKMGSPLIIGEENILKIPFEVLEPKFVDRKYTAIQIVPFVLGFFLLALTIFLLFHSRDKRNLAKTIGLKKKNELELKSIRSQLNPHFMFNALSSIQNLMNKNDIDAANHYLSIFSSLSRKALNTGGQELICLEDEIKLIDDYLQMEKLRFNFNYSIQTDKELNKANIDIPAMLLQPLVENAVKHGVANLRDAGYIEVEFHIKDKALILSVSDNGKGFDTKANFPKNSHGIKLCRERISLLNKIYTKQKITIDFISLSQGIKAAIILKEWI
jgi:two-component system, LytTR family, sensor kinase